MEFDFSYVDIAFKNGKVITVNDKDELAEAVGIKKNKIVFVGSNEDLEKIVDEKTKIIDLKGRALTPGFIDCHFHPILYGFMNGAIIDITYPKCKSIAEIKEVIKNAAAQTPEGGWIKLWGYDQNKLEEKRHVNLDDLDEVAPKHPVQCMRACGHIGVYNTLGLAAGGINTPEDAKKFGKDEVVVENGKLNGMTKDLTNFFLWSKVEYTEEEMWTALKRSNGLLLESGVTSIHDPGECDGPSYSIMYKASKSGAFKPRQFMMLHSIFGKPFSLQDNERFIENGFHTGLGDEKFRIGTCKFMIDGGTSGPSCATRQPYSHDPSLPGILAWEREETAKYIEYINDHDCQATAHAVGDLAIEYMVEGYEKALAKHPRKPEEHRHRIEHCAITDDDLVNRMAKLGIIPVSNTHFMTINGSDYCKYYGERIEHFFAMRSYLDAGIKAVIGCDAPTAKQEVTRGLDGAVNRIDRKTGKVCGASQKISMLEAIRCYTLNGAYASFEDDIKGSIEVGKLADLVVFNEDILEIDPVNIVNSKIDYTMIDGEICYQREK